MDVIRAHARDELGIDIDDMANPLQVRTEGSASRVLRSFLRGLLRRVFRNSMGMAA